MHEIKRVREVVKEKKEVVRNYDRERVREKDIELDTRERKKE